MIPVIKFLASINPKTDLLLTDAKKVTREQANKFMEEFDRSVEQGIMQAPEDVTRAVANLKSLLQVVDSTDLSWRGDYYCNVDFYPKRAYN